MTVKMRCLTVLHQYNTKPDPNRAGRVLETLEYHASFREVQATSDANAAYRALFPAATFDLTSTVAQNYVVGGEYIFTIPDAPA